MKRSFGVSMLLGFLTLLISACSVDMVKLAELDPTWRECRIQEGVMISWDVTLPERWKTTYLDSTDPARMKYRVQGRCYVRDMNTKLFAIGLSAEKGRGDKEMFVTKRSSIRAYVGDYARRVTKWSIDVKERKTVQLQGGFTAKVRYIIITLEGVSSKTGKQVTKVEKAAVAFITDDIIPGVRYVLTSFPNTNLPKKSPKTAWDVLDEFLKSFRRTEDVALLQ